MKKAATVPRKTLVAREDLLNKVSEIAKDQGCSLFELVNDLFQLVIQCNKMGFVLRQTVEDCRVLELAKSSGFILGLERLWYDMVDMAYMADKSASLKSWFDSGVWFAARYDIVNSESFAKFKEELYVFTWNAPEFVFEHEGNNLFVRVTSPRFTEAYSFLFASFLVGALETFGYELVNKEVLRGMIRINSVRNVV
ncbi:MAG: hypothetical protein LBE76_03100 [Nitrososphaerota archaeon]|nr:hypothetical protein [Nitrososphaerota archaeon]